MPWELHKKFIVGGVTSVGIDPSSRYLVVVSHSGRGLFKLSDAKRIARDDQVFGPWYYGAECEGFGPLHGTKIPIFGFGHKTPLFLLSKLEQSKIPFVVEELRGVVVSPDRKFLAVGYTDEIQIYKST
jgi:hypothetical protein